VHAIVYTESRGSDHEIVLAEFERWVRDMGSVATPHRCDTKLILNLQILNDDAIGLRTEDHLNHLHVTPGERDVIREIFVDEPLEDHVRRELGSRDVRDIERSIRIGAPRIIEARKRSGNAEHLLGELHRHHIHVVRVGDGGERVGELDSCFLEEPDIDRPTEVCRPVEGCAKGLELARTIIDNRHVVTFFGHVQRQVAADSAAASDYDSRTDPPARRWLMLERYPGRSSRVSRAHLGSIGARADQYESPDSSLNSCLGCADTNGGTNVRRSTSGMSCEEERSALRWSRVADEYLIERVEDEVTDDRWISSSVECSSYGVGTRGCGVRGIERGLCERRYDGGHRCGR